MFFKCICCNENSQLFVLTFAFCRIYITLLWLLFIIFFIVFIYYLDCGFGWLNGVRFIWSDTFWVDVQIVLHRRLSVGRHRPKCHHCAFSICPIWWRRFGATRPVPTVDTCGTWRPLGLWSIALSSLTMDRRRESGAAEVAPVWPVSVFLHGQDDWASFVFVFVLFLHASSAWDYGYPACILSGYVSSFVVVAKRACFFFKCK